MAPPFPRPCLCLVTDRRVGEEATLVARIAEAVAGGVDMVQLREKNLPGGELFKLALAIKQATYGRALLIINERVDVALASGADGVQLGEDALPLDAARNMIGPQALIGRSVHSPDGALQANAEGADFLIVGTMFATRSHPGASPAGPSLIENILQDPQIQAKSLLLIGIGGVTAKNVDEIIQAGATGAAAITSILASPDPRTEAQKLKQAMLASWPGEATPFRREARGGPVSG